MKNQGQIAARKLKGFQDYMPQVMAQRVRVMETMRAVAKNSGFQEIGSPCLEYSEVLLGEGGETDKQVFQFEDNGGRSVAMRFDLTVPFARFIQEHQGELTFPFKRLQIGDVWRAEKPQKGRYREFQQCDLDIIGTDSVDADVEILLAFQNILENLDVGEFTMKIGHRKILTDLIIHLLGHQIDIDQTLISLDKLDKIGSDKVAELINHERAHELLFVLKPDSSGHTNLVKVQEYLGEHSELSRLRQSLEIMDSLGKKVRVDLSIARGLGYYTGIVFETFLNDIPGGGSVCSGGRYDRLAERFGKTERPGVGGSLGLDRLIALLGCEDLPQKSEDVLVVSLTSTAKIQAWQWVEQLRQAGCSAGLSLKETPKPAQHFRHADRIGARWVILIGEKELQNGFAVLKNMATSEQCLDSLSIGSVISDEVLKKLRV
ncbi:MAG: histidine--tRNA ligase [Oligoflexales bacterium]